MSQVRLGSSPFQKSWRGGDCKGSLLETVTGWEAGAACPADVAGCVLEPEVVCCATADSASPIDKSSVMSMRFVISSFLLSENPESFTPAQIPRCARLQSRSGIVAPKQGNFG